MTPMLFLGLFRELCSWGYNGIVMLNSHQPGITYLLRAVETKWVSFLLQKVWHLFSVWSLPIYIFVILNISSVSWMHVDLILTLHSVPLKFVKFTSYILLGYPPRADLFILIERSVILIWKDPLVLIFFLHLFVFPLLS